MSVIFNLFAEYMKVISLTNGGPDIMGIGLKRVSDWGRLL